ncbi:MAG: AAA family ATPase, partial [Planctomycetales bacterium]
DLENSVKEEAEKLAGKCVAFLLVPESLLPYQEAVAKQRDAVPNLVKVTDAKELEEEIRVSGEELEMLVEIVSNLKIDDATQRTEIIDRISGVFAELNRARSTLKNKSKELASAEGVAEFHSQLKLINQSVANYLDVSDAPEKCEEYLTKLMVQLEELEGKFAEFDEFVVQLSEKRDEIYNAFDSRKTALVEARNKRASGLVSASERILNGIQSRVERFEEVNEIHGYFAADLMVEKVRDLVAKLIDLDDSVRADDVQSRLKTVKEDAIRQLKDRQELYVDGENIIKMGNRRFSVNVQPLDLTTIRRDGAYHLHLSGTNFFERIDDPALNATQAVWDLEVVSESPEVYRAEYLAHQLLRSLQSQDATVTAVELSKQDDQQLAAFTQQFMGPRYEEGYVKGVHDHDAAIFLRALLEMETTIGLLRYDAATRALAGTFWRLFPANDRKPVAAKLRGVGAVAEVFPQGTDNGYYVRELEGRLQAFAEETRLFPGASAELAAEYLFRELIQGERFAVSHEAAVVYREFHEYLEHQFHKDKFDQSLRDVGDDPVSAYRLVRDWTSAFVAQRDRPLELEYVDEAAALLLSPELDDAHVVHAAVRRELTGLVGSHRLLSDGACGLDYYAFHDKLRRHEAEAVPQFQQFVRVKKDVVDRARADLRLEEFRPRVLTSFVRNKLIDTVYLPIIGDNLAKQMGEVGENKRTDLMGLLLLVSPPGYGTTTLMEYVANRLGIIFMKINGPAIGHQVTSLDPTEATNAGAREEVEKLNLSLEMGDNVMIYLDDIQHCNPEFLQKFISLCDGQRKIEGVYKGNSRTYDLRGRKVVVVMAGNPYTESGDKFQIPDMLSNRADVYNLGEILGDSEDAFKLSYLENSLTSNPTLSKLASRGQQDVYAVVEMAEGRARDEVEFEGNYSLEELDEFVDVMQKLLKVRDVILAVNQEYIRSAAQADEYRTEPAFKLQGSYRNMNRIAEKVLPIMNQEELDSLITSQYENDAQTLTTGAEANLLKFRELLGWLNEEQAERWAGIQRTFRRNNLMQGVSGD